MQQQPKISLLIHILKLLLSAKNNLRIQQHNIFKKIICAPEPIVLLSTEQQMHDIKYCTDKENFSIL